MQTAVATDSDPMLWTSSDGVTIRARLAGWAGQRVFLVKDGRYHEVPIEVLSAANIAKAKRMLEGAARPTIPDQAPKKAVIPSSVAINRERGLQTSPCRGSSRVVRTTAYSHQEADHLPYGRRSALGTPLRAGGAIRSAAADWSVYPGGTLFRIKGLPYTYMVDDYGSALVGKGTIDLYHPDIESMRRWGCRKVEITIERWGSMDRSARILASRIRHDHCRRMYDRIVKTRPAGSNAGR